MRPVKKRTEPENEPTALDLFSGVGGLTLGLKQAGFKVLGAVEIDPLAVETYKKNHPEVIVWEKDIRSVSISSIKQRLALKPGELGLLAGCPPCQGFSSMRTLNGNRTVQDHGKRLVLEFMRFVKGLRPQAVMLENVPGLESDNRLKKVIRFLGGMRYTCQCRVLNAAHFGVAQRRKRLILLASRSGPVPFAAPANKKKTVRDAIRRMPKPGSSGDPLHDFPEKRSEKIIGLIRKIRRNGGSRTALSAEYQLDCHRRITGFKDVYGRMAWNDVAPTITGGCVNPSKGRFLHPTQSRSITLREAALLQSFPQTYFFSLRRGKFATAQMIGNALPPEFIKRHALAVRRFLGDDAGDQPRVDHNVQHRRATPKRPHTKASRRG